MSEILGKSRPLPSWNPCAEIIGMIYNASKANMSLADVAEELEHQRVNQVMQVLNMMALSSVTDRIINDSNPLPSYENLDPRVRLDLAEIHSRNGFKSYDYIPISQESLQRTWGEVIPSQNAVPVEGAGETVDKIYPVDPSMQAKDIELEVLDADGNIMIGTRAGEHMPHPTLIGGENPVVQGAGIIEIRAGKIYNIDNGSGHFKPDISSLISVEKAFEELPDTIFHKNFQGFNSFE